MDIKMIRYTSLRELKELADKNNLSIGEYVLEEQILAMGISRNEIISKMEKQYKVMKESIEDGLTKPTKLKIEDQDQGKMFLKYVENNRSIFGETIGKVIARAIAVAELNASMGRICASPTAGSCGIFPAVIVTMSEKYNFKEEDIIKSMFAAAGIGIVIANTMSIAGATGGCQAECGAATAITAAALTELLGGNNIQILDATAISIKNIEGLVCDPVASLVECPCIKRNAHGAISAILAADMAISGMNTVIPVDEVLASAKSVGLKMDSGFKETAEGGLAKTETGSYYWDKIFSSKK